MKYYYDLHIHSALSPCADDDMAPQNIINMAVLCGLDIIAITDHNSMKNAAAVMNASKNQGGPLVIAGMELTTSEDIHVVCLFETVEKAAVFEKIIDAGRMKVANKSTVFGRQLIVDENDTVTGEEESLLITATQISIDEVSNLVNSLGGAAFPAHIDKPYNSAIAVLGDLYEETGFKSVEFSPNASEELIQDYRNRDYLILKNSDSHFLGVMNERGENANNFLELDELTISNVISKLRGEL